jgi:signal transduction histidine kinase
MDEASLLRQARRLRFDDPAQEERFLRFDDERSLRQWRIVTGVGAAAVVGIGLLPSNSAEPWVGGAEAVGRFGLVLPAAVAAFAFSWWKEQRARLQLVGAVCAAVSVSMHFANQAATTVPRMLTTGTVASLIAVGMQYLVAVAATLPLRTKAMATALLTTVAMFYVGLAGVFPELATRPGLQTVAMHFTVTSAAIAAVMTGAVWARERLQRISFAQREALEAVNAELARMNAEKNEFMAIAAHDLRAPLATVGAAARQLRERPEPAATVKSAELIEAQAGRMLGLVNDYLGAHAAESGTLPVRRTRLELGATLREAAERHGAAARAKGQRIATDTSPEPVWVEADPALLAQVTDNFVSNALKFSPRGAEVRLEVHTADGHPRARLAVVDAGPGIAAEEQARLFRKFERGSARPTGGESSHGLGLAVAKRLAEAMDGAVGCESEPGAGATFWVELPRAAAGGGA